MIKWIGAARALVAVLLSMRLVFRDPRLNAHPGWYLRFDKTWYWVAKTERKWVVL